MSCSVVRPDRARRSAKWRLAVLGRMPTRAAASGTEPPLATKAASTSTCRAVRVIGGSPRSPSLMPATRPQPATRRGPRSGSRRCRLKLRVQHLSGALEHLFYLWLEDLAPPVRPVPVDHGGIGHVRHNDDASGSGLIGIRNLSLQMGGGCHPRNALELRQDRGCLAVELGSPVGCPSATEAQGLLEETTNVRVVCAAS